jgi:RING-H2 zinc finger domain
MSTEKVIVEEDVGELGTGGSKKRNKQKGASHALHWEILDNEDIKADEGWEAETEEFWTFKTCKKYVKMYHVDKLWPRDNHESNTKAFACRPWMCKDEHFIYRAEEVWRALFGDRPRSKGFFNYSLVSMVYTELILKQKVDWTTFPTTAQFPLRIGRNQKHIPDLYNPESALTKDTLEQLKKVPRRTTNVDTMPRIREVPETTRTGHGSNCGTMKSISERQSPASNLGGIQYSKYSVEEVTVVPESGQNLDKVVDNILSTTFARDSLDEKTTKDPVPLDIPNTEVRGGEDNDTSQQGRENMGCVATIVPEILALEHITPETKDTGPSTSMPPTLEHDSNHSMTTMGIISSVEEMLRTMPNKDGLKELLDFSVKWAQWYADNNEGGVARPNEEELTPGVDESIKKIQAVLKVAHNLKSGAEVFAAMTPDFLEMANVFAKVTPSVVEAALGFDDLATCIKPLLEERVENLRLVIALEARAKINAALIEDLLKELQEYKRKVAVMTSTELEEINGRRMEPTDAVVCEMDVVPVESNTQTSDNLLLSKYQQNDGEDVVPKRAIRTSEPSCAEVAVEVGCSQVRSEVQGKGKAIVQWAEDTESVLQKLEVANKERDEARAELESLQRTLTKVDYTPCQKTTMPWLGWIHRLQDRETMVSKAQHDLKKYAAESKVSCELVESSLERFKNIIGQRGHEPTKVTIWGDIAEMMDRTNYYRKGKSEGIDWALEVEEGWVPYNIFSSHFVESERSIIHTCDPVPAFLNDKCSLCQEHFGPEGAYTLGQCGHNFHITCISESSMRQSVCPMCRSPISSRFYEVMGIRDVMPPGHEFNRWNLPLDQLPKKFLNYREWGKPLIWNGEFSCHQLYEEYEMECDPFFWMTQDYEVEIRARDIEDDEQRELFCRNFGGHWSTEHKRFFRFPPKRAEKREDGSWHEVEDEFELGEDYKKYNRTVVGRALFLAKLEEAAKQRSSTGEASFKDVGCCYWDAVHAFDKRIGDVIQYWRNMLGKPQGKLLMSFEENDAFVNKVVERIEKAMEIFGAKKVDRTGKRKRDDGSDSDDSWESEMHREIAAVDREYEEGGRIARPSQRPHTRSRTQTRHTNEGSSSRQ